jgi:uncharacterized membrane protein YqjE
MTSEEEEEEEGDQFNFVLFVCLAPFYIFTFDLFLFSIYVEWALWRPFWKRYTDRVEGSVVNRGKTGCGRDTVTIEYAATKNGKASTERRTFEFLLSEPRGCVSLETHDAATLIVRVIPDAPLSDFPEVEWKLQQAPYPLYFYIIALSLTAFSSFFMGLFIPFLDTAKWKMISAMVMVALHLSIGLFALFLVRKEALASMERQEMATDLSLPSYLRQHQLDLATILELPVQDEGTVREEETDELTDDDDSSAYNDGSGSFSAGII